MDQPTTLEDHISKRWAWLMKLSLAEVEQFAQLCTVAEWSEYFMPEFETGDTVFLWEHWEEKKKTDTTSRFRCRTPDDRNTLRED